MTRADDAGQDGTGQDGTGQDGTGQDGTGQDGTGHTGPDPDGRRPPDREAVTELQDSNPTAGGPERAAGGMGISSERVGHTGPGQQSTDGEKDTTEPAHRDQSGDLVGSDAEFTQEPEDNPEGIEPRAGYPSKDPRSD
jgi:hypothetical protein